MSQTQKAMAQLIAVFHKYSGKEGDKLTLSKAELKDLLTAELGDMYGKSQDKAALDKIFKDLDANADGVVDFQEYVTLIACITMLCNETFKKETQQAMALMIGVFHKYSGKEGDKLTLSKGELKDLLTAELGDILGNSKDKTAVDKIFGSGCKF